MEWKGMSYSLAISLGERRKQWLKGESTPRGKAVTSFQSVWGVRWSGNHWEQDIRGCCMALQMDRDFFLMKRKQGSRNDPGRAGCHPTSVPSPFRYCYTVRPLFQEIQISYAILFLQNKLARLHNCLKKCSNSFTTWNTGFSSNQIVRPQYDSAILPLGIYLKQKMHMLKDIYSLWSLQH